MPPSHLTYKYEHASCCPACGVSYLTNIHRGLHTANLSLQGSKQTSWSLQHIKLLKETSVNLDASHFVPALQFYCSQNAFYHRLVSQFPAQVCLLCFSFPCWGSAGQQSRLQKKPFSLTGKGKYLIFPLRHVFLPFNKNK